MKLPDNEYGPVQTSSDAPAHVGEAAQRMTSVIAEGLTRYGQELVKTESQRAMVDVHEGLAKLELELNAKPYVSAQYVRDQLGPDLDKLPAELRAKLTRPVADPKTGEVTEVDQEELPAFAYAGAIYAKKARDLVLEASRSIPGQGWQTAFQDAAQGDVAARAARFNAEQLRGMHTYLAVQQKTDVQRLANAGDFPGALQLLARSSALDPAERTGMRQQLEAAQEAAPIYQALQAKDWQVLKTKRAELDDPKAFPAMTAQQRFELARHVDVQLKARDLAERGTAEADRVWKESGGDAGKALEAVRAIGDVELRDEAGRRVKARAAEEHLARVTSDAPREARLEKALDRFGTLDRTSDDYTKLSDEGQARVEAKYTAVQREAVARARGEKNEQAQIDRYLEAYFDGSIPLRGEAGQDQLSVDIDHSAVFADGSPTLRERLKAKQRKRQTEWAADQGVTRQQFLDSVSDATRALKYSKEEADGFRAAVVAEYDAWLEGNPGKKSIPPDVRTRIIGDAIRKGDAGSSTLGHAFSLNRPGWKARQLGGEWNAFPDEEQSDEVRAVLEKLRGRTGGAQPPQSGPPAAGTRVPGEAIGFSGGTFEMQANGKWKRVQ